MSKEYKVLRFKVKANRKRWKDRDRLPLEADLSFIFPSEGLRSDDCYTEDTELVGSRFLYS